MRTDGNGKYFHAERGYYNNGDSKSNVSLSFLKELSEIQHPIFARMM